MPLLTDLRAALLSFRHRRGFSAAIVATLALGIAPNCVIFAIMDAVYFRPLPYPHQERLVLLNLARPSKASLDPVDAATFLEWQQRAPGFEGMAAYRNAAFSMNADERPERIAGQRVSAGFFATLGIQPSRGRAFTPADAVPGAPPVLVIADRTWRDYFSTRPDIVGLTVRLDGAPATVVGVMPPAFTSFMEARTARLWTPMTLEASEVPGKTAAGNVIARLKDGVSADTARATLATLHSALAARQPDYYRDRAVSVRDFRASLFAGLGPGIRLLSVMVGLLLLIACGNAANLLLGRSVQRSREVAVRTALGAGRPQLARGLVVENMLLAASAAVLGLVVAFVAVQVVWTRSAAIFRVIGVDALPFDFRVVGFAALLTALVTVIFGTLPALRETRIDLVTALKDGTPGAGRGARGGRMSRALVVAQVALCVLTMTGATLVLKSVLHFAGLAANPGFQPQALLVATLPPAPPAVDSQGTPASGPARLNEIEDRLAALPGVERVAVADRVPFLEGALPITVTTATATPDAGGPAATERGNGFDAGLRATDADFFTAMSMPLRRGRLFNAQDTAAAPPVAIIDERLEASRWRGREAVGDRILVAGTWRTVIGVVGSALQPTPFGPALSEIYVPYVQAPLGEEKLILRAAGSPTSLSAAVRRAISGIDPDQPVKLETMRQALDRFMTPFRLILGLTIVFAGIALGLAAVGLYAVIAHGVSRRTREIGVRMALGAGRPQVVGLVVREGLRVALVGLVVGLLPGLALARIVPSEIVGAGGLSFAHFSAALALWLAVALIACLLPARRAARVEPISALRAE